MTRTELDHNLKRAVATGTPVEVFDPSTNKVYYLLSADQFHSLAASIAGDIDPRMAYPLVDQVMADDDAADPLLDTYQ